MSSPRCFVLANMSDEQWLTTIKEAKKPARANHFYVLAFEVAGKAHVKVGTTEKAAVADRKWTMQTTDGVQIPFRTKRPLGFPPLKLEAC